MWRCGRTSPRQFQRNRVDLDPDRPELLRLPERRQQVAGRASQLCHGLPFEGAEAGKQRPVLIKICDSLGDVVRLGLGKTHYFAGSDARRWRTNVPGYAKVVYKGLYSGVDVVFQGDQGSLRYDFVVAPGTDPGKIGVEFEGARGLRVDQSGDLLIETAAGEMRQRRPTLYQEERGRRVPVEGRYIVRGLNLVGVEVAAYNRRETLVIDPTLVYSTYFGHLRYDRGRGIAAGADGAPYLAGTYTEGDDDFGDDAFVAKFDPTGKTLVWFARLWGHFGEQAAGLALDSAGNAYVTGWTASSPSDPPGRFEFPRTPDALQPNYGGGPNDAFVSVLSPDGILLYSTFLGGSGDDLGPISTLTGLSDTERDRGLAIRATEC